MQANARGHASVVHPTAIQYYWRRSVARPRWRGTRPVVEIGRLIIPRVKCLATHFTVVSRDYTSRGLHALCCSDEIFEARTSLFRGTILSRNSALFKPHQAAMNFLWFWTFLQLNWNNKTIDCPKSIGESRQALSALYRSLICNAQKCVPEVRRAASRFLN